MQVRIYLNGTNGYPKMLIFTTWTPPWLRRCNDLSTSSKLRCNVEHHSKKLSVLTPSLAYLFLSISLSCKFSNNRKKTFPENFECEKKEVRKMESGFPPQKQETQPGIQHVMDPTPQFSSPNYKPSNKLHVCFYCYIISRFGSL